MLLSWAQAFTASKLPGSPESLVFWLSLKWHKPTGLSGSENQMKVGDGLNSSAVPPGNLDGCFSVLSELFKDKESTPIWGIAYSLHLLKFRLLIHFFYGRAYWLMTFANISWFLEDQGGCYPTVLIFLCWQIIYLLAFSFLFVSL